MTSDDQDDIKNQSNGARGCLMAIYKPARQKAVPAAVRVYGNSYEERKAELLRALPLYLEATMGGEKFKTIKVDANFNRLIVDLTDRILAYSVDTGRAHLVGEVTEMMQRSTYDQETRDLITKVV